MKSLSKPAQIVRFSRVGDGVGVAVGVIDVAVVAEDV